MARNSNASYESDDNRRVPLSGIDTSLNYKEFATLDDFVRATNGTVLQTNRGCSFTFRDTGGWCPRKTAMDWYRCLIVRYQNPIGSQYDVSGTAMLTCGASIFLGYITGTTTFTVNWYTLVEEGGTMREAVPAFSGGNCALNGHFAAGHTGWVAMTSHDQNNINTRHRLQLGQDGTVYVFKTTTGDGGYSSLGRILRDDQISAWTSGTITPITSYVNGIGYTNCYCNQALKLATFSLNCNISANVPSGGIIMTGLPKSVANRVTFSAGTLTSNANARLFVNRDGQVVADGPISTIAWYNGSVTYPYSSL